MNTSVTTIVLILGLLNFAFAQESTKLSKKQKVWIKEMGSRQKITSYLIEVKDSSVVILRKSADRNLNDLAYLHEEIYYYQIEWIRIKKASLLQKAGAGPVASTLLWLVILGGSQDPGSWFSDFTFRDTLVAWGLMAVILTPVCFVAIPSYYRCKINGDFTKFRDKRNRIGEELF